MPDDIHIEKGETLYANRIQNQRMCMLAISKESLNR